MSLEIFKENLDFLMRKRKLTRTKLAEKMRVNDRCIEPWLAGRAYPRMRTFIDLCNALECYDMYAMLTVNLKNNGKPLKRTVLPDNVATSLQGIIELANQALEK